MKWMTGMVWLSSMAAAQGPAPFPDGGALGRQVRAMVAEPGVAAAHWGVAVERLDGTPIFGLNEGQLFQPASNAKLFMTAAAIALLKDTGPDETRVVLRRRKPDDDVSDLVIIGAGDGNFAGSLVPYLSSGERAKVSGAVEKKPLQDLEDLADKVVAAGVKEVRDVIGDDTLFPYEPYPPDWAQDDLVWGYGAPVSALTVNDNQVRLTITPGKAGQTATVTLTPDVPYYTVNARVSTVASPHPNGVRIARSPGSRTVRVYGEIYKSAEIEEIAIDDPAEYAAVAFAQMLSARGVKVEGRAVADHVYSRDLTPYLSATSTHREDIGIVQDRYGVSCMDCGRPTLRAFEHVVATHPVANSLLEDVVATNKTSQNLHAELLLHLLGKQRLADGSTVGGERLLRAFLLNAGIADGDFVFYDGSGLSGHDLVTPRAAAKLLQYAAGQPWGAAWKASLPIGGVDGSLAGRFTAAPMKGHVFAKTGTLGEARALSGYLECKSGLTVVFSVMVGNHLPGTTVDREVMDRIVKAIWAAE